MKVSVITVCFNTAKTIEDTLNSVKSQKNIHIEHVIIDGGSTDGTLAILNKWNQQNSYIRLQSEPDQGIYDGFNKGLKLANGDIIGFLNADDFYTSTKTLESIVSSFEKSNADIVYGDLDYVDHLNTDKIVRSWKAGYFTKAKLKKAWIPPHPSFFFKRELLQKVSSFNLEYSISGDYDFMLRCLLLSEIKVHYLPEVIVKMRTGGVSNNSFKTLLKKISQDASLLKNNKQGGYLTAICKRISKVKQWF